MTAGVVQGLVWFEGSGKGGSAWRSVEGNGEGFRCLMSANVTICEAKAGEIYRESAVLLVSTAAEIWIRAKSGQKMNVQIMSLNCEM